MNIQEAILNINVLRAANPASIAALMPFLSLKRFEKNELLFLDKEVVETVYFLSNGVCLLYKLGGNEEKRGVFIYGPGAMLNEVILDERPASINCEFLASSEVLCISRNRFLSACEQDFMLTKAVMDSMALKIRRLYHQMKNTTNTVRGDKRIAAKLWKLSRDYGVPCERGVKIDFDLTITFLAELMGYQRETVSRQIKTLSAQGLVIADRGSMIIPDREKLQQYCAEVPNEKANK